MARTVDFAPQMSDAEGLMWRLEKDPHLSSSFASVGILDKRPDVDALRRRMERAALVIPRLRQRVQPAPVNLAPPLWVDDTDFDINNHVRHISLPRGSSMRDLYDLVTLVLADPFERTRPLWQFTVVDGLPRGRSALVAKMHHTMGDGEASITLSLQYLDFERTAPERPLPSLDELAERTSSAVPPASDPLRDLVAGSLRMPLGLAKQIKDLLADPTQFPTAGAALADTVRGVVSQLSDVDKARSPLWTARSLRRRLDVVRYPFAETKAAAKRLGGTLNVAFITAAAEASSLYHERQGVPVDQLRASMAISTRNPSSGANAFTLARMLVPTAPMPITERFAAIQEAIESARSSSANASLETLSAVAATLPTSLVTRLARQQAQTVDFATSNVRGSPVPMYVAGAQILQSYPVGPLSGVAFNLTLLSYCGELQMGLHSDAAAIDDPALLARQLEKAFASLTAA
jgi:WS/DGAT/MGAT family acyltransferase